MSEIAEKIALALNTYWHCHKAMRRQFDAEKLRQVQNAKLRNLITYSYKNIKYYHELFDKHGIVPSDIHTVEDLVKVPVLTKEQIRKRFWDFLPKNLPACRVSRTSGSTGVPVCMLSDKNSRIHNSAAVIRYRKALGIPFIGMAIITPLKTKDEPQKLPHWTFLQGIHKTYYVNPYSSGISEISYGQNIIRKLKYPALIGITSAIRALAYRIQDGILPPLRPSVVLTTGELLTDQVRGFLENNFKTKVVDIYACNETGDIAWQCKEHLNYHINADNCVVEILQDDCPAGPGATGEVTITNLNRFSMPIIRYKNGDLAHLGEQVCPCGCRLPVIGEIIGRTGEDIWLCDGTTVPWNVLKGAMNDNRIRKFQIVQNQQGAVVVKYLPEKQTDINEIEELLRFRLHPLLEKSVDLSFEKVAEIAPAQSGKSKLVISHYRPNG